LPRVHRVLQAAPTRVGAAQRAEVGEDGDEVRVERGFPKAALRVGS
jgi:hypothetical protein